MRAENETQDHIPRLWYVLLKHAFPVNLFEATSKLLNVVREGRRFCNLRDVRDNLIHERSIRRNIMLIERGWFWRWALKRAFHIGEARDSLLWVTLAHARDELRILESAYAASLGQVMEHLSHKVHL